MPKIHRAHPVFVMNLCLIALQNYKNISSPPNILAIILLFFLVVADDGINTTFASYCCLLLHKQRASLPYLKNATG